MATPLLLPLPARQPAPLPFVQRRSDIPLLANYFLKKYSIAMNKPITEIAPATLDILVRYHWPGNVRELENVIERAMVLAHPPAVQATDLPFQLLENNNDEPHDSLKSMERKHIQAILHKTGWNITRAAEILDIDRVTLYNKISKYGFKKP